MVRREPGNGLDAVDLAVDELLRAEIFLADGVLPELQVVVYVDIALDRLQVLRAEPDQRIAVRDQVHRRRADKGRDEGVRRRLVDLPGRADLLDATVIQYGDPMPHAHRLDLIVRHIDRRRADLALEHLDLIARRGAHLRVQVGQGLVEQEDVRLAHQRPGEGDALPLATRELAGFALQQFVYSVDTNCIFVLVLLLLFLLLADVDREGYVVPSGHVRPELIVLNRLPDLTGTGLHVQDHPVADQHDA